LDEEVLGVMCVNRYDKKFDESDQTAAEVFATYASTALINSKAHNQLRIEIEERWKAEEALRQSENLYRLITENISDAVWIRDLNLRAVFISPSVTRLRGYSTEEAIAQTVEEICTPESAQTARLFFAQILCEALSASPDRLLNESRTLEMEMYRKDGSTIWTESVIKFILDANNQPAEIIGATRDISERKSAEEKLRKLNDELEERVRQRTIELSHVNLDLVNEVAERKHAEDIVRASLREKEILLKEIHHRVKNNLQIISSLLNLQSNQVADVRTLQALVDSRTRVRSMALIHEKLYQSQNLTNIDFAEYVKSLSSDLFRSYSRNLTGIRLDVQADEVTLDIDHAISCGLILNELMTNALKYAFPDGKSGTIWVELRTTPEHFLSLRVADNGVGIPSGFDALNSKSLGLQLVKTLSGQLGGTMELEQSEGTAFRISFRY
jgi:PAS domain S-box-containing protein